MIPDERLYPGLTFLRRVVAFRRENNAEEMEGGTVTHVLWNPDSRLFLGLLPGADCGYPSGFLDSGNKRE